jgi:hypothetical protein
VRGDASYGPVIDLDIDNILRCYPEFIFLPGLTIFECEDELYARYYNTDRRHPRSRLEIIIVKHPTVSMYGHYIRFYGLHNRFKRTLLIMKETLSAPKIYFSPDFEEAAIVGSDEKAILRVQKRELNFYMTHLSVLCKGNENYHHSDVSEIKKYTPFTSGPENPSDR